MRAIGAALDDGYPEHCVAHACRLVELLIADGEEPWIVRLRDRRETEHGVLHGPLIPHSLRGEHARTWTTHYAACAGSLVFDPLAVEPTPLDDYAQRVFGRELALETFLDVQRTAELFAAGKLRAAMNAG